LKKVKTESESQETRYDACSDMVHDTMHVIRWHLMPHQITMKTRKIPT